MKIITHTPRLLVVRETAGGSFGLGLPLIGMGVLAIALGLFVGRGMIFGAILTIAGTIVVATARASVYTFDAARHTLTITRRGVRGTTREEIDFHDIAGLATTRLATSNESLRVDRIDLALRDGSRHPWTVYISSDPEQQAAIDAARDMLALAEPVEASDGARVGATGPSHDGRARSASTVGGIAPERAASFAPATSDRPRGRAARKGLAPWQVVLVGIGMVIAGVLFLRMEVQAIRLQHRRVTTYRPVPARVLSSTVSVWYSGRGSRDYRPLVRYSYVVNGRQYESSTVTPVQEGRSSDWASAIARRFTPGQIATAYYDPLDPSSAILIRDTSLSPYLWIVLTMLWIAAALFMILHPVSD